MIRDYGILTRARSPYNDSKTIVNIAGGYGEGTLAGCRLLTMPSALSRLMTEGGQHFQALYTVSIDADGVLKEPKLLTDFPDEKHDCETIVRL